MLNPDETRECKAANVFFIAFLKANRGRVVDQQFDTVETMMQMSKKSNREKPYWLTTAEFEASQPDEFLRRDATASSAGSSTSSALDDVNRVVKHVDRTRSRFSVSFVLDSILVALTFLRGKYYDLCRYIESCMYVALHILRSHRLSTQLRKMRVLLDMWMNLLETLFGSSNASR